MDELFGLGGRTALVTGSVRGLGREIALALAGAGAKVFVNGRDPASVAGMVDQARVGGLAVEAAAFDVTDPDRAASEVDRIGPIDVLVNNVGHRDRRGVDELDPDALRRLVDSHVVAAYHLSRCMVGGRDAAELTGGRIINISSVTGQLGRRGDVGYSAVKAGVDGLTRGLAADLGPRGITVNAIAPGTFATGVNSALTDDPTWTSWLQQRTALGRWGQPHEIAGAAVFLASDAASYVTGHTLNVDGGLTTTF